MSTGTEHIDGEIRTSATINGRRITLDPVMEREPLAMPVRRVENSMPAGFRVDWLNGKSDDGVKIALTVGAGVGSPWMILRVDHPELGVIEEIVNVSDLTEVWVEAAIAAGATPKVGESA